MTNYRSLQDKPYLGHWDLPPNKDVIVYIERWEQGEVFNAGKTQGRGVLFFRGKKKGMVLNTTNGDTIEKLHGEDMEGWVGKPIALYVGTTRGKAGEAIKCIRVRPVAPKVAPKQTQDDAAKPAAEGPPDAA